MKEYFLIAKISSLYGSNGFVKTELYSDFPERFSGTENVLIDFWGDKKLFFIESVKYPGRSVVLKFKNFDDEREAGVLIGRDIFVETENLAKLPDNNFFVHDLIGSKVFQLDKEIGEISDVLKLPANDVLVIKRENESETLIPLVLEFIEEFDPEKKRLILKQDLNFDDED